MAPADGLARVREASSGPAGDALPPPRTHDRRRGVLATGWLLLALAAVAALVGFRVGAAVPRADVLEPAVAAALTTLLATGLAWRTGGRPVMVAVLAAALGGSAVATGWEPALAGAAVGAAVVGAALAVVLTVPARSPVAVVREVCLALLVAGVGSLAAAGYAAPIDATRFTYAALALAVLLALAVVRNLGGGVHGLGRLGVLLVAGGLVLLVFSLAYAWALERWGAPGLVEDATSLRGQAVDLLGAAPAPLSVLVGVPCLVVGVAVRDRRRQGWWVCAFGATATAPVAAGLAVGVPGPTLALATVYAALAGLLIGLLVLVVLRLLRRPLPEHHRPEPSRTRALR